MRAGILNICLVVLITGTLLINSEKVYPQTNKQPDKITLISDLEDDEVSYIRGEVVKLMDEDEFKLKDGSGEIKVYTGWKNTHIVKLGEKITVKGELEESFINKEFYAAKIVRENGEKIILEQD